MIGRPSSESRTHVASPGSADCTGAEVLSGASGATEWLSVEWSHSGSVEFDRNVRLNVATSGCGHHQEYQESSDEAKSRNSGL